MRPSTSLSASTAWSSSDVLHSTYACLIQLPFHAPRGTGCRGIAGREKELGLYAIALVEAQVLCGRRASGVARDERIGAFHVTFIHIASRRILCDTLRGQGTPPRHPSEPSPWGSRRHHVEAAALRLVHRASSPRCSLLSARRAARLLRRSPHSRRIGRNFADHAKELNNAVPTEPFFFLKPTSSYIGTGDAIEIPKGIVAHFEGTVLA